MDLFQRLHAKFAGGGDVKKSKFMTPLMNENKYRNHTKVSHPIQ